ncbi:MAG TPA: hypothetical protein VM283_10150, partial [Armatimonadota bacterium]|nr:hypothetical protein [Armatimonadota bacterium]
ALPAGADAGAVRSLLSGDAVSVTNYAGEVVVYVRDLDLARLRASSLSAEIELVGGGATAAQQVDLAADYQTPAIVLSKGEGAAPSAVSVRITADGEEVFSRRLDLGPEVSPRQGLPLSGLRSAIEPGQAMGDSPVIELPDLDQLRVVELQPAERQLNLRDITAQVRSEVNYPLVSANNNCAVSRQTAHPDDPARRSVYVPTKSQLFDPETGDPTQVAHYLVEVPLDEQWLAGEADLAVSLPPSGITVHNSDQTWPPGAQRGTPILGNGAGGLGQLVGTVTVDDSGRIYYSSVPSGLARFDPATAKWQVPPIDLDAYVARWLPALDQIPDELKRGDLQVRWEGYKIIAFSRGRVFYAPIITAVYQREDRTGFVFAGLMSVPVDGWDDPAAFEAGVRFHAGSWPGAEHSFFEGWTDPDDRTRKLGRLFPRADGLYITAYQSQWGGPWKLEFDDQGNTVSFERVDAVPPATPDAPPISASGLADWRSYGLVSLTRAGLARLLHGGAGGQLAGSVQVNYDAIASMRLDPERYASLLAACSGPSLAPAYMAIAIPGRPDTILGVAEYGYYLATFDLSDAEPGIIRKRWLLRDLGGADLQLPLEVGLGPYGWVWWREGDSLYLYMGGYTGLTRLVYQSPGQPADRYRMEDFTYTIKTNILDEASEGPIKRFRYLQPGLDGRIFLSGTHTAARAGNAYSGGLMSFRPDEMTTLDKLSFMSRCYWTGNLRNRVVYRPGSAPVQQLFLGGTGFDESYAFTLDAKLVPANHDQKIFTYEYESGGVPRSVLGFSLPPNAGETPYRDHAFDRTRRYLVILQGDRLMSFDVVTRQFADGIRLSGPQPVQVVNFFRPSLRLVRTPDDRLMFYATAGESPTEGTFHEVEVATDGALGVRPHLTLRGETPEELARTFDVVRAFVPDLRNNDGSCDLFLGAPWRPTGTDARVVRDLPPPRR